MQLKALRLLDISGKVVKTLDHSSSNISLDTGALPAGFYVVHGLTTNSIPLTQRLVVR